MPSLNLIINYKSYTTNTKGLDKVEIANKTQTAKGTRPHPINPHPLRVASSELLRNATLNKKRGGPSLKIEVEGRPFSFNNTQVDMKVADMASAALGLATESTSSLSSIQPSTSTNHVTDTSANANANLPAFLALNPALASKLQLPIIQIKDIRSCTLTATGFNNNKQNTLASDSSSALINTTRVPQSLVNHAIITNNNPTKSVHANHQNHLAPDFSSMLNLKSYQLTKFDTKPTPPPPMAFGFNSGPGALRPRNPKKLESDFYDTNNENEDDDDNDDDDDDDYHNVNHFTDSFKVLVNDKVDEEGGVEEGAVGIDAPVSIEQLDSDSLNYTDIHGLSKIKPNNIVFSDTNSVNSSKQVSSKQILLIKNRKRLEKKKSDLLKISNPNKSAAAIKSGIDTTEHTVVTHDASLPQVFGVNIQNDKSTANESNFF